MVYSPSYGSSSKTGDKPLWTSSNDRPSWAFDATKEVPRTITPIETYRIPYPQAEKEPEHPDMPFLCARIFLVIINSLFFVLGLAMTIMAIATATRPDTCPFCYATLRPLLIIGMLTTLISVVGLFGAACNSYRLLLMYVTAVAFLLMLQMIVFFWCLFSHHNFRRRVHSLLKNKMRRHPGDLTPLLNIIQSNDDCCGVDGPMDYHIAGVQVPPSCCSGKNDFECTTVIAASTEAAVTSTNTATAVNATTANLRNVTANVTAETTPYNGSKIMSSMDEDDTMPELDELRRRKRKVREEKKASYNIETVTPASLSMAALESSSQPTKYIHADNTSMVVPVNVTFNSTTTTTLPSLFKTADVTGGPESWDLDHAKIRGCHAAMWNRFERSHAMVLGTTFGAAVFICLQIVILCNAHQVARGGFIYES